MNITPKTKAQKYLGNDVQLLIERLTDGSNIKWLLIQVKQQVWQTKDGKSSINLIDYFGWKTYEEVYRFCENKFHNLPDTQSLLAQLLFKAGFQTGQIIYRFNVRKFQAKLLPMQLGIHPDVYFCICPSFCDLYFHFVYGIDQITCAQVLVLDNWRSHSLFEDFDYSNYKRSEELKITTSDVYYFLEEKILLPEHRIDRALTTDRRKEEEYPWAYFMLKNRGYHKNYYTEEGRR